MSRNEPNMPKPTISAVTFVVQTPRIRIIRMSTSGSATRSSKRAHATSSAAAAASSASTGRSPSPSRCPR